MTNDIEQLNAFRRPQCQRGVLTLAEALQLGVHRLDVTPTPVNALALGAAKEVGVRPADVGRNAVNHVGSWYLLQPAVAHGASGKRGIRRRTKGFSNLPNLLLKLFRVDEQHVQASTSGQLLVSGEQDTPFGAGTAGQLVVGRIVLVSRIIPKQTEPLRKSPEHTVGQ